MKNITPTLVDFLLGLAYGIHRIHSIIPEIGHKEAFLPSIQDRNFHTNLSYIMGIASSVDFYDRDVRRIIVQFNEYPFREQEHWQEQLLQSFYSESCLMISYSRIVNHEFDRARIFYQEHKVAYDRFVIMLFEASKKMNRSGIVFVQSE